MDTPESASQPPSAPQQQASKRASLRIDASERDRWFAVLAELAPNCTTQQTTTPSGLPVEPNTPVLAQVVADQSRPLAWS